MSKKTFFDFMYSAGAEALNQLKKPGRIKMIKRAADRKADELEQLKIDAELERTKILEELVKTADEDRVTKLFEKLAEKKIEIEEAEELAKLVKAECSALFAEYEPVVE